MATKEKTISKSLQILKKILTRKGEDFLNFKNHRKHVLKQNTFSFTIDILSLDILISIMENPEVKNVYFNPSVPPPGGSIDIVSLRYNIYVEYR